MAAADEIGEGLHARDRDRAALLAAPEGALQAGGNQTVLLQEPIPVHIVYDTAWVGENGTVEFRDDVYHRDVIRAVAPGPVAPGPAAPSAPGLLANTAGGNAASGTCSG